MNAYTRQRAVFGAESAGTSRLLSKTHSLLRWWRAPLCFLALFTGAKSFVDNPIIGSRRLNRAGLHVLRLRAAHWAGWRRRRRLARFVPPVLAAEFDRDGFVVIPGAVPETEFRKLQKALLRSEFECRSHRQGNTITRRVPVGGDLRRQIPALDRLLRSPVLRSLMAYVSTSGSEPLFYVQTISAGIAEGPRDPQTELHSDTFHPSLKAWLFLTDVNGNGCPLTYVAGSHRLSDERVEWERRKSVEVLVDGDRLSQRGSFRVQPEELPELRLPPPTRFCVSANTLVIADTFGFHSRAQSPGAAVRVELWAYSRPNPFFPWLGPLVSAIPAIALRQAEILNAIVDLLDRWRLRKQHWKKVGRLRPVDP